MNIYDPLIKDLQTKMCGAIKKDDGKAVRLVFKTPGIDELLHIPKTDKNVHFINMRNEFGHTFLHEAVIAGKEEVVEALLRQNHIDLGARTPVEQDHGFVLNNGFTARELAEKQKGKSQKLKRIYQMIERQERQTPVEASAPAKNLMATDEGQWSSGSSVTQPRNSRWARR